MTGSSANLNTSDFYRVGEDGRHLWTLTSPTPHLLKAGSTKAGCSEECPVPVQSLSLQGQRLLVPFFSIIFTIKNIFCLNGTSLISICVHQHLSFHWTSLRIVQLHFCYSLSSDIYTQMHQQPCLFLKILICRSVLKADTL